MDLPEIMSIFKQLDTQTKKRELRMYLEKLSKVWNLFDKINKRLDNHNIQDDTIDVFFELIVKNILIFKQYKKEIKKQKLYENIEKIKQIQNNQPNDNSDDLLKSL